MDGAEEETEAQAGGVRGLHRSHSWEGGRAGTEMSARELAADQCWSQSTRKESILACGEFPKLSREGFGGMSAL